MDEVITHKCPNCGGPLTFNTESQQFHCDYCLSTFSESDVLAFEKQQQTTAEASDTDDQQTRSTSPSDSAASEPAESAIDLFLCPSCGAEIATDATTAATFCYYCHNPVVLSGRISGEFLPDTVLPFKIGKEEAVKQFLAWTSHKKFIPKDFFNKQQVEKLTGVYFPYWLVDSTLNGAMQAKATRVSVWRVGDIEYTRTTHYSIIRKGLLTFKALIKNALSKNQAQKMIEAVLPFQVNEAVPFKSQYLAGFQAEKRDIAYQDLKEEITRELTDYTGSILKQTVSGYATVTVQRTDANITEETKTYTLLPVWLLTYRARGDKKIYYYAMNGQTGKIGGILPLDKKKLGFLSLGIGLSVFALALIGGYFLLWL